METGALKSSIRTDLFITCAHLASYVTWGKREPWNNEAAAWQQYLQSLPSSQLLQTIIWSLKYLMFTRLIAWYESHAPSAPATHSPRKLRSELVPSLSFAGQFAPRTKSSSRSLELSVLKTFILSNFCSLELSLHATFATWSFHSSAQIGPGTFFPWNLFLGLFAAWNFHSLLVHEII